MPPPAGAFNTFPVETRDLWRRLYSAGLRRLRQAGIRTVVDEEAEAEVYVSLRRRRDGYISNPFTFFLATRAGDGQDKRATGGVPYGFSCPIT
jgi:hypothetical protein